MKTIVLTTGLALTLFGSTGASAAFFSYDLPRTNACYEAATLHRSDQAMISNCTLALSREATTDGEIRAATLVNRGILLSLRNDSAAAMHDFDSALTVDPQQPEAWLGKALETWQGGNDRDAAGFANHALALGTSNRALAYLVRGLANEGMGNIPAAYADLVRAREIAPGWDEPAQQLSRYRVIQR